MPIEKESEYLDVLFETGELMDMEKYSLQSLAKMCSDTTDEVSYQVLCFVFEGFDVGDILSKNRRESDESLTFSDNDSTLSRKKSNKLRRKKLRSMRTKDEKSKNDGSLGKRSDMFDITNCDEPDI